MGGSQPVLGVGLTVELGVLAETTGRAAHGGPVDSIDCVLIVAAAETEAKW